MKRRQFILTVGAGVVPIAGCTSLSGKTDNTESRTPTTENGQTSTTTSKSSTTESHTPSPTGRGTSGQTLTNRLVIHNGGTRIIELKVILTSSFTGNRVHAKTYTLKPGEEISLKDHIKEGNNYQLLLKMNGGKILQRPLGSAESYEVAVYPDGSIRIFGLTEI